MPERWRKMKWTIGRKLFGSFGLLFLMVLVMGIFGQMQMATLNETKEAQIQTIKTEDRLRDMQADHYKWVDDLREAVRSKRKFKGETDPAKCEFGKWHASYQVAYPELKELFAALEEPHKKLHESGVSVMQAMKKGDFSAADKISLHTRQVLLPELMKVYDPFVDRMDDVYKKLGLKSAEAVRTGRVLFGAILVISLATVIALGLWLARSISRPMVIMAQASKNIAEGNLNQKIEHRSGDEIGSMAEAFRTMVDHLQKMMRETNETVNVLAVSSSEITATVAELASSAAEAATAVNETTTTVAEVKQAAVLSSQKANSVSESANRTMQVSQDGKRSLEQTIEGMNHIRGQMETIADTVVRLSEQSQAIGEMVATVNDIAEQSNLLAVNAAIEAAKAGEQGKGFAVVAQEIKSLAEQSKRATAQVRSILRDVQKGINSAVIVTEQGSKAVEAGVKQAALSGEAILVLAENAAEAAQAGIQIAVSSQQQVVGMDQVALAMDSINQASAQNVAGTREVETAAQNLQELGLKLKQLLERYGA